MTYTSVLWVHGVAGVLQIPSETEDRYGNGLHIYNRSGKHWVHFPMPVSTGNNSGRVITNDVYVKASLNENARIVAVHVWAGGKRLQSKDLDERGPHVDLTWDMLDLVVESGLLVCVQVEFLSGEPIGSATFHSVGMKVKAG